MPGAFRATNATLDPDATMALSGMFLLLFATAILSSLAPVVNAEVLVLGAALAAPEELGLLVAATAAAGQVAGKWVLYRGARGVADSSMIGRVPRAARTADRLRTRPVLLRSILLSSALIGLPPLYLMAVVAGITRLAPGSFLSLCALGRFGRFYALVLVPDLFVRP